MSLLPSRPDTSAADEAEPRVVGVDSDRADELMSALSSETARQVLMELHDDPAPPSELADRVDTSLQNAQYHLENLEDAGAVEVIDTAYSEKGREMDIYAPADRPLVLFAGREEQSRGLRTALRDLVTGVGGVAIGAVIVQEVFGRSVLSSLTENLGGASAGAGGGGDGAAPTDTPAPESGGGAGGGTATPTPESGGGTATPTPSDDIGALDTTATQTGTETAAPTGTPAGTPTPQATGTPTAEPLGTPTEVAMDAATETATATAQATSGSLQLPPGLVFFLGGVVALLVVLTVTYYR